LGRGIFFFRISFLKDSRVEKKNIKYHINDMESVLYLCLYFMNFLQFSAIFLTALEPEHEGAMRQP